MFISTVPAYACVAYLLEEVVRCALKIDDEGACEERCSSHVDQSPAGRRAEGAREYNRETASAPTRAADGERTSVGTR